MASLKGTTPRADYLSKFGAKQLAASVESYWRGRGYHSIEAESSEMENAPGVFQVRSNIMPNGYPPGGPAALRALV